MKKIIFATLILATCSSFAKPAAYVCTVVSNPTGTALVAGDYFKLSVDDNFGINSNFTYPVQIESAYLGRCEGDGRENKHPLAEGYVGAVSLGGSKCSADGFDIFASAGMTNGTQPGLIQVDVEPDAVFYSCTKIRK